MARRRRRYGGIVSLDLGRFDLRRSLVTRDVLVGIGVGVLGAAGMAYALRKARSMVTPIPFLAVPAGTDWLKIAVPLIGGAVGGYGAYYLRRRKNGSAAYANLIGAILAGAAITVWPKVAETVGFAGLLVDDPAYRGVVGVDIPYSGLLVDDATALRGYADRPSMARLAASSLDGGEDYRELGNLARFSDYRQWAELDVEGQG